VEVDQKNVELARNYTYLQHLELAYWTAQASQEHSDSNLGCDLPGGVSLPAPVARNDQPLSPKEQKKEEDKLRKMTEQRRKETNEQRERRIADSERRDERHHEP